MNASTDLSLMSWAVAALASTQSIPVAATPRLIVLRMNFPVGMSLLPRHFNDVARGACCQNFQAAL
ncbi:MAG: hypothetical protein ABL904_05400, partial [Hyphomicrobiaceae bacterium]